MNDRIDPTVPPWALESLDERDRRLYRIEQTLAAIADALLEKNKAAYDDGVAQFDALLKEQEESE